MWKKQVFWNLHSIYFLLVLTINILLFFLKMNPFYNYSKNKQNWWEKKFFLSSSFFFPFFHFSKKFFFNVNLDIPQNFSRNQHPTFQKTFFQLMYKTKTQTNFNTYTVKKGSIVPNIRKKQKQFNYWILLALTIIFCEYLYNIIMIFPFCVIKSCISTHIQIKKKYSIQKKPKTTKEKKTTATNIILILRLSHSC